MRLLYQVGFWRKRLPCHELFTLDENVKVGPYFYVTTQFWIQLGPCPLSTFTRILGLENFKLQSYKNYLMKFRYLPREIIVQCRFWQKRLTCHEFNYFGRERQSLSYVNTQNNIELEDGNVSSPYMFPYHSCWGNFWLTCTCELMCELDCTWSFTVT